METVNGSLFMWGWSDHVTSVACLCMGMCVRTYVPALHRCTHARAVTNLRTCMSKYILQYPVYTHRHKLVQSHTQTHKRAHKFIRWPKTQTYGFFFHNSLYLTQNATDRQIMCAYVHTCICVCMCVCVCVYIRILIATDCI